MATIKNQRELGAALRGCRHELGLTQGELARRVGVNREWVIAVESGSGNPQLKHLMRAFDVLRLDFNLERVESSGGTPLFDVDQYLTELRHRGMNG